MPYWVWQTEFKIVKQQPEHDFDDAFRAQFTQLIKWRRDVRRFRPEPVDPKIIDDILDITQSSPSVGLSEPWRFVPVKSDDARAQVMASFKHCNGHALAKLSGEDAKLYAQLKLEGLSEAPVQFAVFSDHASSKGKGLGQQTMPEMLDYSVVIAVHTFWLAARAHGVGVGWVSILDPQEVAKAVDAPADWSLVAYLCVGWPVEDHLDPELERAGWEQSNRPTLNSAQ